MLESDRKGKERLVSSSKAPELLPVHHAYWPAHLRLFPLVAIAIFFAMKCSEEALEERQVVGQWCGREDLRSGRRARCNVAREIGLVVGRGSVKIVVKVAVQAGKEGLGIGRGTCGTRGESFGDLELSKSLESELFCSSLPAWGRRRNRYRACPCGHSHKGQEEEGSHVEAGNATVDWSRGGEGLGEFACNPALFSKEWAGRMEGR